MDGVVVDRGGGWPRHKRAPVAKERDDLAFVLGPHIRRPTILADNAAPFTPLLSLSLFLLLPLHARAYVRESRFFSPFTPLPGSFSLSSILLPPPLLFLSSAFSRPGSLRVPRTLGQSPKGQQEPQGDTQKYDPT